MAVCGLTFKETLLPKVVDIPKLIADINENKQAYKDFISKLNGLLTPNVITYIVTKQIKKYKYQYNGDYPIKRTTYLVSTDDKGVETETEQSILEYSY